MSKWKKTVLSDILNLISGGTPKTSVPEYWDGNIPWLSVSDFNNGRKYVYNSEKFITELGLEKSSTNILKKGQIIISARGTVGVISMLGKNMAFNQSNYGINAKKGISENQFLFYLFKNIVPIFLSNAYGAVFNTITKTTFDNIKINLPSFPEQRAIASVLSSLDDKIDLLHRQNITLEKMAETLFRQWFIEDAKEDWEESKLGNFIIPKKGKNITKTQVIDGKYPVIAGGLTPSCYHNECNTKAPVITVSASGANAGFVNLHNYPVWSSDSSFIDYSITPYIFFYYIFLKLNQTLITDKQEGSAQPHIYPSHIMDLDIYKYPEELIQKFENICSDIFNKIKNNQTQIRTLEKLRDTLLPKLMSGEVKVSIDG